MATESRSDDSGNSIKMETDTVEAGAMEAGAMEADAMEADAMETGALEAGADNQANIWLGLDDGVCEEEIPPVFSKTIDGTESIQNFFTLLVLTI